MDAKIIPAVEPESRGSSLTSVSVPDAGSKFVWLAVALVLLGLLLLKLPVMDLPFFMDEAWSYAPAVRAMYESGPSLFPGSINPEHSRGHPLLFYFLSSGWMRIFGDSLFVQHAFAFFVSSLLLLTTFWVGRRLAGPWVGLGAMLLLAAHPSFYVQSVLLLPELLVALFCMGGLAGWVFNLRWLYLVSASLLLLTKESGIAFMCASLLFVVYTSRFEKQRSGRLSWVILLAPFLPVLIFFVWQNLHFGWFFFPDHMTMIERSPGVFFYKTWGMIEHLFFYKAAAVSLFIGFFCGSILIFRSWGKVAVPLQRFCILSLLFACFYLGFSALNFLTVRYLMALIPILAIGAAVGFQRIVNHLHVQYTRYALALVVLIVVYIESTLWYTANTSAAIRSDTNMAYVDVVQSHQKIIDTFRKLNVAHESVAAHFLMYYNMKVHACGYLRGTEESFNVESIDSDSITTQAKWVLLSNVEADQSRSAFLSDTNRFATHTYLKQGHAEAWILKRKIQPTEGLDSKRHGL